MNPFPVVRADSIPPSPPEQQWLVESLWGQEAVGVIGGEPKCGKSLLALNLAVAVASGRPCLGRFAVHRQGPVLYFAAEDALHIVRSRLDGLSHATATSLAGIDVWLITAPTVRLDVSEHRSQLADTVRTVAPALVILDPFVRLHRRDENASADIVPMLAYLRDLQRTFHCAIAVVHHSRKGAGNTRAGQALRGSSEFHAWADAGLFLRRHKDCLTLSTEHRAHPSIPDLPLVLAPADPAVALAIAEDTAAAPASELDRILSTLASHDSPLSLRQLQPLVGIRTQRLSALLHQLADDKRIRSTPAGWQLMPQAPVVPFPALPFP